MASDDKFQFVKQNIFECWCDLGAALYGTIFTISNSVLKTQRDHLFYPICKKLCFGRAFLCIV